MTFAPIKLGRYAQFVYQSIQKIFFPPLSLKVCVQHAKLIGNESLGIIVSSAVMIGSIFGLQFGYILKIFGAESLIGAAAALSLSKELAPVIGSFLVTARAGSSMAAEIATMRVNEQIDALQVMTVDPIRYLVSPRIFVSIFITPLLSSIFVFVGIVSAYVVGIWMFDVDQGVFTEKIIWLLKPKYLLEGIEKAVVFGFIFSSISCYKGFYANGGTKGVGKAVTQAVVYSLISILIVNFFISYLQIG